MHKFNTILVALIITTSIIAGALTVTATSIDDISFPISELGNCNDKDSCKTYCDNTEHIEECVSFARLHNLMSENDAQTALKYRKSIQGGTTPGGCNSKDSCNTYCEDVTHIRECLDFAEGHGHDVPNIEEARRIADHIENGGSLPGNCNSKGQCEAYCEDFDHFDECMDFAEDIGFDVERESDMTREQMRKVHSLMASGDTPGGCQSETECMNYCEDFDHFDECMDFADKMGFSDEMHGESVHDMSREQLREINSMMKNGDTPGGCKGQNECEAYCQNQDHMQECIDFSVRVGFMSEEEAEQIKAPGEGIRHEPERCDSPESCQAYCEQEANFEECSQFGGGPKRDFDGGRRIDNGQRDGFEGHDIEQEPFDARDEYRNQYDQEHRDNYRDDYRDEYYEEDSAFENRLDDFRSDYDYGQEYNEPPHILPQQKHQEEHREEQGDYRNQYQQQFKNEHQKQYEDPYQEQFEDQPRSEHEERYLDGYDEQYIDIYQEQYQEQYIEDSPDHSSFHSTDLLSTAFYALEKLMQGTR